MKKLKLGRIGLGARRSASFTATTNPTTNTSTAKLLYIMNTRSSSNNDVCGYKILDGSILISPRRTARDVQMSVGGEAWRMSARGLHDMEVGIRQELQDLRRQGSEAVHSARITRRFAGARAEARAGYAVDGKHEWGIISRHSAYIPDAQARVSAANVTLEDLFDSLHALDRISDAAISCFVSFPEARPGRSTAVVHQFISRAIMRNPEYHLDIQAFADLFQSDISQPLVDAFSASINPNNSIVRTSPSKVTERRDSVTEIFRDLSLSPASRNPRTMEEGSFSSHHSRPPSPFPSTSLPVPTATTRVLCVTAADALDFGTLVEEALAGLRTSEITALKVKLIVLRVADKESWPAMFRDVGLSADGAALVALIMKHSARI